VNFLAFSQRKHIAIPSLGSDSFLLTKASVWSPFLFRVLLPQVQKFAAFLECFDKVWPRLSSLNFPSFSRRIRPGANGTAPPNLKRMIFASTLLLFIWPLLKLWPRRLRAHVSRGQACHTSEFLSESADDVDAPPSATVKYPKCPIERIDIRLPTPPPRLGQPNFGSEPETVRRGGGDGANID